MAQDRSLFMKCFLRTERSLRSYLLSLLQDADAMEEVFQEVSLILWDQFDRYDESRPFLNWALGVARNQAAHWRHQRARVRVWLKPEVEERLIRTYADLEGEMEGRRRALGGCLEKLGAGARELLGLRYERGLTLQRIAELRRMSLNAVNKALARIRGFLAECTSLMLHVGQDRIS